MLALESTLNEWTQSCAPCMDGRNPGNVSKCNKFVFVPVVTQENLAIIGAKWRIWVLLWSRTTNLWTGLISLEKLQYPLSGMMILGGIMHKDDKKGWLDIVEEFTYVSQQLRPVSTGLVFPCSIDGCWNFSVLWRKAAGLSNQGNFLTQ